MLTRECAIADTTVGPNASKAVAIREPSSSRTSQVERSTQSKGQDSSRSTSGGQLTTRSAVPSTAGPIATRPESSHRSTTSGRSDVSSTTSALKEASSNKHTNVENTRSTSRDVSQRSEPTKQRRAAAVAPVAAPIYEEEEYEDYPEEANQQITSRGGRSQSQSQASTSKGHSQSMVPSNTGYGASQARDTSQAMVRRPTRGALIPHQPAPQPAHDQDEEMIVKRRWVPLTEISCPGYLTDALKQVFKVTGSKVRDWYVIHSTSPYPYF